MNLYELTSELAEIEKDISKWAQAHEGDITDYPYFGKLDEIEKSIEEKALSIGVWIKNLLAEEKALKEEIAKLQARAKSRSNKASRLKDYLMRLIPYEQKFENTQCKISWRKSEAVKIEIVPELLPTIYQKIDIKPDKTLIKKALKSGDIIPDCSIETKQNLNIK